jgi:hypothetical protein
LEEVIVSETPTPNVAQALRDAGFRPLPRLWIRNEDMPAVYSIVATAGFEVRAIREQAILAYLAEFPPKSKPNPVADKEAAWAAYERSKEK